MAKQWTHAALCDKAVSWLKKPFSKGGHGCCVALSEVKTGTSGEIPDGFGIRVAEWLSGSVLVEVKVSRSDFLSDKSKPHRKGDVLGVGRWRYYLCPEGLILPAELPDKWGLIYVTPRGGTKTIVGPYACCDYKNLDEKAAASAFECDMAREQFLLAKVFSRISNPEALHKELKALKNDRQRLAKKCDEQRLQLLKSVPIDNEDSIEIIRSYHDKSPSTLRAIPRKKAG
mgnify:CR=1 FL=1